LHGDLRQIRPRSVIVPSHSNPFTFIVPAIPCGGGGIRLSEAPIDWSSEFDGRVRSPVSYEILAAG